jgi:hypothetical protein
VSGFFRSISLSLGNSLQDTLRLLTLWFKYGHDTAVDRAMTEGFGDVSIDTWLQVIPQVRSCSRCLHACLDRMEGVAGQACACMIGEKNKWRLFLTHSQRSIYLSIYVCAHS